MGKSNEVRCIVCDEMVPEYEYDFTNEVCLNCFFVDDFIDDGHVEIDELD